MRKLMTKMAAVAMVLFAGAMFVNAADEKKAELTCPVAGTKIDKMDNSADYKGGKVYFCCGDCAKKFAADPAKFSVKANHQLFLSGQATQEKCPLSGGKLNPDTGVDVSGAKVTFCCNNCKGKVAAAKGDEQAKLVFDDAAFEKGFKVTAKK